MAESSGNTAEYVFNSEQSVPSYPANIDRRTREVGVECVVHNADEQKEPRLEAVEPEPIHYAAVDTPDGQEPTVEEMATLEKVAGPIPWSAFLVAVVELAERFTYYGVNGPFQNYMQHPYDNPSGVPGAIGMGTFSTRTLSING